MSTRRPGPNEAHCIFWNKVILIKLLAIALQETSMLIKAFYYVCIKGYPQAPRYSPFYPHEIETYKPRQIRNLQRPQTGLCEKYSKANN